MEIAQERRVENTRRRDCWEGKREDAIEEETEGN